MELSSKQMLRQVNSIYTHLLRQTCSSVLRSPNSSRKVLSDGNCRGSRKFNKLNNSSTEFCRGVPVSRTLCSCWKYEPHCIRKKPKLVHTSIPTVMHWGSLCKVWTRVFSIQSSEDHNPGILSYQVHNCFYLECIPGREKPAGLQPL